MDTVFKNCTLHEALSILEEEEDLNPTSIFIEPPQPNIYSEEDSGDDDDGGFVNNLSGRQLNSRCEVVLGPTTRASRRRTRSAQFSNQEATTSSASSNRESSVNMCLRGRRGSRRGRKSAGRNGPRCGSKRVRSPDSSPDSSSSNEDDDDIPVRNTQKAVRTWVHEDIPRETPTFPEENFTKYRELSPTDMIELFLDDDVYTLLADQAQKYAAFLNCPDPKITKDELVAFVAILILSGYNSVPSKIHYWDQGEDLRNNLVYNCMRRDRFKTIMRFLHCADNNEINTNDKMWKLRPLVKLLKEKYIQNYVPHPHLNYDESMIEYFGKHGCKQFIRGKPIRFGYKNWCLNTPYGYLIDFELYQGKSIQENVVYDKKFGKAAAPLVKIIDNMPEHVRSLPMSFYFDNLFTSFQLLSSLKERGYEASGTVRDNRLPKDIPLPNKKVMAKNSVRGSYEFTKSQEEDIVAVRWKDNSVVTGLSTVYGVEPLSSVGRYSASEKKKIMVPRPSIFTNYNRYMGGTDLMDQNVSTYRIGIRGKKWWWPIFTYLIDVSVCNAWVISRRAGNPISQLDFRRHIAQTYLTRFRNVPKCGGRPQASKQSRKGHRIPDDIRYDNVGHYLVPCHNGQRRRCGLEHCKSQTQLQCSKCNVGLCAKCNYTFHT